MDILNSIKLTLYLYISRDWCSGVHCRSSLQLCTSSTDVTPYIQYCTAIGERSLALARLVVESAHQIATAVKKGAMRFCGCVVCYGTQLNSCFLLLFV